MIVEFGFNAFFTFQLPVLGSNSITVVYTLVANQEIKLLHILKHRAYECYNGLICHQLCDLAKIILRLTISF